MRNNIETTIELMGSKSKNIINYAMEYMDLDEGLKLFIKALNHYNEGRYLKAIEILKDQEFESQKHIVNAARILIESYLYSGYEDEALAEYTKIKAIYENTSGLLKQEINLQLAIFEMQYYQDYRRIQKFKESKNNLDNSLIYLYKARAELLYLNHEEKGFEYLKKSYNYIKNEICPGIKVMSLNAFIYYSYKYKKFKKIPLMCKEFGYDLGYWYDVEDLSHHLPSVDTLIETTSNPKYMEIFTYLVKYSEDKREKYISLAKSIDKPVTPEFSEPLNYYKNELAGYKDRDIKIPSEIYISHLKKLSWEDTLVSGMKMRIEDKKSELPIVTARCDLAKKFLKSLGKKRDDFDSLYFSLNADEQNIIDRFVLNHERYKHFCDHFSVIEERPFIYDFFDNSPVEPFYGTLILFLWNKEERKHVEDVVREMVKVIK